MNECFYYLFKFRKAILPQSFQQQPKAAERKNEEKKNLRTSLEQNNSNSKPENHIVEENETNFGGICKRYLRLEKSHFSIS